MTRGFHISLLLPALAALPAVASSGHHASVASSPSASAARALLEDDACRILTSEGGSECALEALQTSRKAKAAAVAQGGEGRGEEAQHSSAAAAPVTGGEVPPDELPPWELIDGMDVKDLDPSAPRGVQRLTHFWAQIGANSPGCAEYTAHFWPQLAFWAQEVGRRLNKVEYGDEENLQKVRRFAHQAAYLVNIMPMDPRSGQEWSEPVQAFFREVAAAPGLDMPELPDFFRRTSNRGSMVVSIFSMTWFQVVLCDLDWWATNMARKQAESNDTCWTTVPHPGYGYSPAGVSLVLNQPPWPITYKVLEHPEYLACQEADLNSTFFEGLCPLGGHVKNFLGVEQWGKGVPEHGRESVLQCQAKLGEEFMDSVAHAGMASMFYFDTEGIDLGKSIDDGPGEILATHSTKSPYVYLRWLRQFKRTVWQAR